MFIQRIRTFGALLCSVLCTATAGCGDPNQAKPTAASFKEPAIKLLVDPDVTGVSDEKAPGVISTKAFGDLVLDRDLDWYEGNATWNGEPVVVHFSRDGAKSIDKALKTAEVLWADQARWKRDVQAFAAKELLESKNLNWLEEGEKPLTKAQFLGRMRLESISVSNDGDFTFWHDDGDLFGGHSIEIRGNLKDGLTVADTPG